MRGPLRDPAAHAQPESEDRIQQPHDALLRSSRGLLFPQRLTLGLKIGSEYIDVFHITDFLFFQLRVVFLHEGFHALALFSDAFLSDVHEKFRVIKAERMSGGKLVCLPCVILKSEGKRGVLFYNIICCQITRPVSYGVTWPSSRMICQPLCSAVIVGVHLIASPGAKVTVSMAVIWP